MVIRSSAQLQRALNTCNCRSLMVCGPFLAVTRGFRARARLEEVDGGADSLIFAGPTQSGGCACVVHLWGLRYLIRSR